LVFTRDARTVIERRAQARPICSIFEQKEPWTEPQLNVWPS